MERKGYIKKRWCRITAMLLIAGSMIVLLCGCNIRPPIQTEANTTTAPQETEILDTTAKVVAYVEKMVQDGAEEMSLVCSAEVYDALMKVTFQVNGVEWKALHSLMDQAGAYSYDFSGAGMKKIITITDIRRYPGCEILCSIDAGKEEMLSSELKKTLAEARSIADACRTPDPLETAQNIQSALCSRIRYAYMTNMSNADTAIGALLNGTADCDGYADAFYLVGNLAGLEVRYQQGIAYEYDLKEYKIISASHMWNLLKLDGSWRVVDVCWADAEDGVVSTWFNIGKDRASRSRSWQEALSVPLLEKTDLSTRPETEYSVNNGEELETAIQKAVEKGQSSFALIFDNENYGSRKEALDVLLRYYTGEIFYSWDECSRVLTIFLEDNGG